MDKIIQPSDSVSDFVAAAKEKRHAKIANAELNGEARAAAKAEIVRLASLDILDYAHARPGAAKKLQVRVSELDELVKAARPPDETPSGQGRSLEFPTPEPWPDPVDGAKLLAEIEKFVKQFVIMDSHAAAAVSLWVALTWFEEAAQIAPILSFRSPTHRCGKSTAIALVGRLVKRRLLTPNTTPAALFRAIEKFFPTIIIDEADSFFAQDETLRGLINSGHTRERAFTLRTVGEDLEPKSFSTWGFKAIAGIGKLSATIADRAITIDLQRKLPSDKISRLRHADPREFSNLSRKLSTWASCNLDRFAEARPTLPDVLNDRQQDNWEHMFAVAALAGGDWPSAALAAALAICTSKRRPLPRKNSFSPI